MASLLADRVTLLLGPDGVTLLPLRAGMAAAARRFLPTCPALPGAPRLVGPSGACTRSGGRERQCREPQLLSRKEVSSLGVDGREKERFVLTDG